MGRAAPRRAGHGDLGAVEDALFDRIQWPQDGYRLFEVGHFIGELVGMQSTQFVQVAMLPQGEFQRFLRASTQDRHDVLQHLFHTDRFGRIEEWVQDHSRTLRTRTESAHEDVRRLMHTIADRCGVEVRAEVQTAVEAEVDARADAVTGEAADGWAQEVLATWGPSFDFIYRPRKGD